MGAVFGTLSGDHSATGDAGATALKISRIIEAMAPIPPISRTPDAPQGDAVRATGVLLAGGGGRRLGMDKVLVPLWSRPFGARVFDAMAPCVSELIVSADRTGRIDYPGARTVLDARPGFGPLAGISAALAAAGNECVFVAACDYPLLEPDAVRALIAALGDHDVAAPESGGTLHPLCAAWARRVGSAIDDYLESGGRSVMGFVLKSDLRRVQPGDLPDLDTGRVFINVNTPEELRRVEALTRADGE